MASCGALSVAHISLRSLFEIWAHRVGRRVARARGVSIRLPLDDFVPRALLANRLFDLISCQPCHRAPPSRNRHRGPRDMPYLEDGTPGPDAFVAVPYQPRPRHVN